MQFSSGLLQAIKGMTLSAAKQYLQDVGDKKRHRRQARSQADVSLS
jgi:ribosomal protein L22